MRLFALALAVTIVAGTQSQEHVRLGYRETVLSAVYDGDMERVMEYFQSTPMASAAVSGALAVAVSRNHTDIVNFILASGVTTSQRGLDAALRIAAQFDRPVIAAILLRQNVSEAGVNVAFRSACLVNGPYSAVHDANGGAGVVTQLLRLPHLTISADAIDGALADVCERSYFNLLPKLLLCFPSTAAVDGCMRLAIDRRQMDWTTTLLHSGRVSSHLVFEMSDFDNEPIVEAISKRRKHFHPDEFIDHSIDQLMHESDF